MNTEDIKAIKILSRKYIMSENNRFLKDLFLIFYKERIVTYTGTKLVQSKRKFIKPSENELFDLSNSSIQELNHFKICFSKIINGIEDYLSKDNYEDKKICETCIYVLKRGLIQIQERIITDEEQIIKEQLRELTYGLEELETPGEEDISSFFE